MAPVPEEPRAAHPAEEAGREPTTCPFCESGDVELVSLFGSQLLVSQFRCRACRSYFEAVRDDRWQE